MTTLVPKPGSFAPPVPGPHGYLSCCGSPTPASSASLSLRPGKDCRSLLIKLLRMDMWLKWPGSQAKSCGNTCPLSAIACISRSQNGEHTGCRLYREPLFRPEFCRFAVLPWWRGPLEAEAWLILHSSLPHLSVVSRRKPG